MGPCGGPFLLVVSGLAAPSLGLDSGVVVYSFMAWSAWNCMTCCDSGSNPHGHPCRQPELFGNSRHNLDDALEHRVGPGEPIEFANDRGAADPEPSTPGTSAAPDDVISRASKYWRGIFGSILFLSRRVIGTEPLTLPAAQFVLRPAPRDPKGEPALPVLRYGPAL
jgi:hypothetical protein